MTGVTRNGLKRMQYQLAIVTRGTATTSRVLTIAWVAHDYYSNPGPSSCNIEAVVENGVWPPQVNMLGKFRI